MRIGTQANAIPLPNIGPYQPQQVMPRDQIANLIKEMCGPIARGVRMPVYRKPYPKWVDRTYEFPRGYKMPDFSLFNEEREQSTIEHVARFTT